MLPMMLKTGQPRGEVVIVGEISDPVVSEAERELESWVELDLVLEECARFVSPIDTTTNVLLSGKRFRRSNVGGRAGRVVSE
jgi:hypothetical protein